MARIRFLTWDGGGNLPPALAIALELNDRGHEVRFAGYDRQRDEIRRAGFAFDRLPRMAAADWTRAEEGMPRRIAMMQTAFAARAQAPDVTDVLAERPADLVIVDCLMHVALAAAREIAPTVVLIHSVPGAFQAGGPPLQPINAALEAAGFPAIDSYIEEWSRSASIVATVPELDPFAAEAPPSFRYIGPVIRQSPDMAPLPWPAEDPRPLVLVSFSTTSYYGDQSGLMQRALAALAELEVRVLLTTGPAVEASRIRPPANAFVTRFAPHQAVLPGASLVVTHAGHGTVTAALAAGVPLLALPNQIADQPFLAGRIAELGAGLALTADAPATEITAAAERLLAEPGFRGQARRLQAAIERTRGVAAAGDELEAMLRVPAV